MVVCPVRAQAIYYFAYIVLTILGNVVHEWFFAFHMIDALLRYKELNIVLLSVYRPLRAFLTTAALFFVLTYFTGLVGFSFFESDFPPNSCNTSFHCTLVVFDLGFKQNGGVGTSMFAHMPGEGNVWWERIAFDNVSGVLVVQILTTIVFGITIDQFKQLKEESDRTENDMRKLCAVCNIDRCARVVCVRVRRGGGVCGSCA